MKASIIVAAFLMSAQAAASCDTVDLPSRPANTSGLNATETAHEDAADSVDRRDALLDCLRPAPFVSEGVVIELDSVAKEFDREGTPDPDHEEKVAGN
jgi:hypothetical protein